MRKMAITAMMATVLAGAVLSPLASAAQGPAEAQVVLHRDGDRAVPFDPIIGPNAGPALRRDPSQAVPFAAPSPQTSSAGSGLSSSDALIGAGLAALALAGLAVLLLSRRRAVSPAPTPRPS